jgi:hypothetical protein
MEKSVKQLEAGNSGEEQVTCPKLKSALSWLIVWLIGFGAIVVVMGILQIQYPATVDAFVPHAALEWLYNRGLGWGVVLFNLLCMAYNIVPG